MYDNKNYNYSQDVIKWSYLKCWNEVNDKDKLGQLFKYLYLLNYGSESMKKLPHNTFECKLNEYPTYKCRCYLLNVIMPSNGVNRVLYQDIRSKISAKINSDVNRMRNDWDKRVQVCQEEMKQNGDLEKIETWEEKKQEWNVMECAASKGVTQIKPLAMFSKLNIEQNEVNKLVKKALFVYLLKQRSRPHT